MIRNLHTTCALRAAKSFRRPHISKGKQKNDFANSDQSEEKIWDKLNISKHEFFIRKYGNITPEERKKLDDKVKRQKLLREAKKKHLLGDDYYQSSKPAKPKETLNPLCEYVYGTHPVIAALTAKKRDAFSKLFIHNTKEHTPKILKLAKNFGVKIIEKDTKGEMNVLSSNGVHNGVVLETKPLSFPLILTLENDFDGETGEYSVTLMNELTGDEKSFQHTVARHTPHNYKRFPFGLLLDGITDPQNVGSIIRTAYYLGVDFIVIPESESARLGPATAKASAGALDLLTIYKTDDTLTFLDNVRKSGWNVVTTSSRMSEDELNSMKSKHRPALENKYIEPQELPTLMNQTPMLMVFGSEGAGVRTNIKFRSDYLVGLPKGRLETDEVVDSLNVGVAASLLVSKCFE